METRKEKGEGERVRGMQTEVAVRMVMVSREAREKRWARRKGSALEVV